MKIYTLEEIIKKYNFKEKVENNVKMFFLPNFGWNTIEQLDEKRENIEYIFSINIWCADPSNYHNCDDCPYNNECTGSLPCGQQKCWVAATIEMDQDYQFSSEYI